MLEGLVARCFQHLTVAISFSLIAIMQGVGLPAPSPDDPESGRVFPLTTGIAWAPYLEWELENPSYSGNPFDLVADVSFTHTETQEKRETQMFYDGQGVWKFRFTGTRTGEWTFVTHSEDPDLDGHSGTIQIEVQTDGNLARGFVSNRRAPFWSWSNGDAFIPVVVMYRSPAFFHDQPEKVDSDIELWFKDHGFNGLHVGVFSAWFNIEASDGYAGNSGAWDEISGDRHDPDLTPDLRTFEALEQLITKAYEAGGFVHIWMWGGGGGGSSTKQNVTGFAGGIDGPVDRRLQRYVAARLGPLPGWTLGYGWDVWGYAGASELESWHVYLHEHLGWEQVIGARAHRNDDDPWQITDVLDYVGHEDHATINHDGNVAYDRFVEWFNFRPEAVHFSEDRFRLWESRWPSRNFDEDRARRTLWHAAMAGGAATIWGQTDEDGNWDAAGSLPLNAREQFRVFASFWEDRFLPGMKRSNEVGDGYALMKPGSQKYVFYQEDTDSVTLDLGSIGGPLPAVAVDTKAETYRERELGPLDQGHKVWEAPYRSDWVIAVGDWQR